MSSPFELKHHRRIVALIVLVAFLLTVTVMRAFQFQVVNGGAYLADTQRNSASTITITAARGEIVDRKGVPLTKNKAVFNIEFDHTFMQKGSENEIIHRLILLFEKRGEEWIDDLPITKTQPYEFIEGMDAEIARLKKNLKVNDYATAENCMEQLYRQCGIKKYQDNKGRCTHCKEKFDVCDYEEYSEEYSRKLAGVRAKMLEKGFSGYNTRYTFAEDVSPTMVALIREFASELVGVETVEKFLRTYLSGDVASHLIGSLGPIYAEEIEEYRKKGYSLNDTVGKSGIERALEDELRGKNGTMQVIKNSQGDIVDVQETVTPVAGKTIRLTLDYEFQKELQQLVADYIKNYNETNKKNKKTESAAVVVLDVKSNGVLASVSYPYYDINSYKTSYSDLLKAEGKPLMNYALNGTYRPGSTFKPVVAAAALSEGVATTTSTILCTGRYTVWGTKPTDYQPSCLRDGHGLEPLNVSQALNHSCNIYFYDTGRTLGIDRINKYASLFGLATDTGIEIGSTRGNLSSPEFSKSHDALWVPGNVVQAAIGQMDTAVTPLQMAVEASTIANRGTRYSVHLVDSILSNDGKTVIEKKEPVVASSFEMSDEAYTAITSGMVMAAQRVGAPNQLTDLGYSVAIKTGTPQVSLTKENHAFIALSSVENPEIAVACMMDDGNASQVLMRKILLAYERSKGIVREQPASSNQASSISSESPSTLDASSYEAASNNPLPDDVSAGRREDEYQDPEQA